MYILDDIINILYVFSDENESMCKILSSLFLQEINKWTSTVDETTIKFDQLVCRLVYDLEKRRNQYGLNMYHINDGTLFNKFHEITSGSHKKFVQVIIEYQLCYFHGIHKHNPHTDQVHPVNVGRHTSEDSRLLGSVSSHTRHKADNTINTEFCIIRAVQRATIVCLRAM